MNTTGNSGPRLLITRPVEQSGPFATMCQRAGFCTVLLPCLEILPVALAPNTLDAQCRRADHVLFTSVNAVKFAHTILPLPWPNCFVHAIGAATAQALHDHGQQLFDDPLPPYNSESFLRHISAVKPTHLLLIKGVGGRTVIPSTLLERGWQVDFTDVYRRELPNIPNRQIDDLFNITPPDIVSVGSDQVLANLWQLCTKYQHLLNKLPLIVNSQRCARQALELGFNQQIMVAEPAGNEGQFNILCNWWLTASKM